MAYSDAQREATERYNRKTYERIELKVKKGQKDYIQKAAASVGKSVNRFKHRSRRPRQTSRWRRGCRRRRRCRQYRSR